MPKINITVAEKIATNTTPGEVIVCGNSDYSVKFALDSEWDAEPTRTARFIYYKNGLRLYKDKEFTGDTVAVPKLSNIAYVEVGVYAGDLRTTTPAKVLCDRSILCGDPLEDLGPEEKAKLQAQIGDLKNLKTTDKSCLVAAINEAVQTGGGSVDAVLYTAQELSEEQKKQARKNIGAASLDESGGASGAFSNFGAVFNASEVCQFNSVNKTFRIPGYSRIVYGNSVIVNTGTTAWNGVTVDLTDVPHGFIVFDKTAITYTAQAYTDTEFSDNEIILFEYSNYGTVSVSGLSPATVDGITILANNSVTTDKIADKSITAAKIMAGAIDSTATTVAGRNAMFFNKWAYCNFDTVNKKLYIPGYSRIMCGKTVYAGTTALNNETTLDLSSTQHGYVTYNTVAKEWKLYPYTTTSITENELILFVYANYGEQVSSSSVYTINGRLYGVNTETELEIPAGFITKEMLAPKLLQNQLSRCPRYTYTDMSAIDIQGWSDICFIGGNLWMFFPSSDEEHTASDGTIKIVNKETLETIKTISHNFGHVNTCDYCKETDCLIVGNLPGNSAYPAALYIFYNVSEWANATSLDFTTVEKTIVDMRGAFPSATAAACSWGETNFAYSNIVYVSFGYDKQFTKIVLGMGSNQLTNGTFAAANSEKFNGTYNILQTSDFEPMGSGDEVIQGATFYNGRMLTANGDEWTARASLWQFDINGNIQRELLEFPIYNANGEKNTQYKTYTEGIAVDDETGYVYQGIFSGQLYAIRFYLIKYKL